MIKLGKYSLGIGDRFGKQGTAQLRAIIEAGKHGVEISPVWNKSNREHIIVGSQPEDVRKEADESIKKTGFRYSYHVDADHINKESVDSYIDCSDYFTIDVAAFIGYKAGKEEIQSFLEGIREYTGRLQIPGIRKPFDTNLNKVTLIAEKYLFATIKAWEIYRKIEKIKGRGNFITEISMDEVSSPQTPEELFFILKMIAEESIPVQTIAPKFPGRFNKGIDYEGDVKDFAVVFEQNLMVIDYAIQQFGLPSDLKMSIHSGSDKFSIYPYVGTIIKKHDKGIHLKTAGTTWLEEYIGLAESGGKALSFAKELYYEAMKRSEELCAPYSDVIDINMSGLPSKNEVSGWEAARIAEAVRHVPENRYYSPDIRQLIHVSYKLAAEKKDEFLKLISENEGRISQGVFTNLYHRHICRLFDIS